MELLWHTTLPQVKECLAMPRMIRLANSTFILGVRMVVGAEPLEGFTYFLSAVKKRTSGSLGDEIVPELLSIGLE